MKNSLLKTSNPRLFEKRVRGNLLEVWVPPVDSPEGELVLTIHTDLVPALIAILKHTSPNKGVSK